MPAMEGYIYKLELVQDLNFRLPNQIELKFGLSEKHTKFEKIFLMVLTNQLIYLVNVKTMRTIFSNIVRFSESPNFNKAKHCLMMSTNF